MSSSGLLTFNSPLDFELLPSYSLSVQLTDDGYPQLSSNHTLSILVENVNEHPHCMNSSITMDENLPIHTSIPYPLSCIDPENNPLTYSLVDSFSSQFFFIHPLTGSLSIIKTIKYNDIPNHMYFLFFSLLS